jgi:two-component system phosphate regulon sensor histidine kinase PhoR
MQLVNKLQVSRILMIATIVIIAAFQCYWLTRLYKDEKQSLGKEVDVLFRETVYKLQLAKFKKDTLFNKGLPDNLFVMDAVSALRKRAEEGLPRKKMMISVTASGGQITRDSIIRDSNFVFKAGETRILLPGELRRGEMNRVIFRSSLGDSLSIPQLDSAYKKELAKSKINLPFTINSIEIERGSRPPFDSTDKTVHTNFSVVGLHKPVAYQAIFGNTSAYLFGKLTYPMLVSLLLIALTTASFVFLYRNLLAQRRLTDIKNEFISNITHELKTPIATVNVAIEALKSFNAMENPQRTQEYLDISSSELQRLSLLVDKVLKLSLFENKDIELKIETFDLKLLTEEVIKTMQLQLQKRKAILDFETQGSNFNLSGDKLHITSVVYNLLDNALKYSLENPLIKIHLAEKRNSLELKVQDNGIGISAEYKDKVFEKFFRVPHGNTHNIKGYGLGLSYVAHVIDKHKGSIELESEEGKGSTFTVNLLKES